MKRERELACEYLDFLYEFLKTGYSSPEDFKPKSIQEKISLINVMLKRFAREDEIIKKQLELYLEIEGLRKQVLKELAEYMDSIQAACLGRADEKITRYLLESSENHILNALEACKRIESKIGEAKNQTGAEASQLILNWIKDNHKLMLERLQRAVKILKAAGEELEKIKQYNKTNSEQ
ncbi:MAG: hypothetical protein QW739_02265 [Candidatus Odinarchaeota archaeon]